MVNVILTLLFVVFAASAEAGQDPQPAQAPPTGTQPVAAFETVKLSGPRVGMTFLSDGVVETLQDEVGFERVGPVVSQFGWQWEKRFSTAASVTPVTEWAFLAGGLEQGVFIPSLSWLVGLRTMKGVEFAVGPNFAPAGVALAIAGGVTLRAGSLNFPLNLAVVPSKSGTRVSFLAGFNARQR